MNRPLTFRIPVGFDPSCLLTPVRDYGCWFLDLLYRKTLRLKAGDFVNLKSDYIRKVVPDRRWPGLRDRLEECGVLQCDHIDRYGKKSFGYRLAQFESQRIECKHQQLRAKLQSTDRMERSTLQPVHLHLESWLKRLTIDPRVAEATIRGMEPKTKAGTAPLTEQQYQTVIREQCLRLEVMFVGGPTSACRRSCLLEV